MRPTLLLVDDDPQIVRAILPALRVSGLEVTVAVSALEALNHLKDNSFDALVVDLGLPDGDGKDVVRTLRTRSAIPVVVISARHSEAEVVAAFEAGADAFLHKPFATPDLVKTLKGRLN